MVTFSGVCLNRYMSNSYIQFLTFPYSHLSLPLPQPPIFVPSTHCGHTLQLYTVVCTLPITFSKCIHRRASDGCYGFHFVTPQCVERFHRYRSNKKYIIVSLLKFAGYIHHHKILLGNIFDLILKNKMAATGIFFYFQEELLLAL